MAQFTEPLWISKMSRACVLGLIGLLTFLSPAYAQAPSGDQFAPSGQFTGLYLGADVGAGIGATGDVNTSGYIGGLHIGYDLQIARFLLGVEADVMTSSVSYNGFDSSQFEQKLLSSARARAGYTFGDLALYATGGMAFATTAFRDTRGLDKSSVKGWAYGAGIEWLVLPKIGIRAELLRYDFGDQNYTTPLGETTLSSYTNMLRAGAHYRF